MKTKDQSLLDLFPHFQKRNHFSDFLVEVGHGFEKNLFLAASFFEPILNIFEIVLIYHL
jgi:hypothetical protein